MVAIQPEAPPYTASRYRYQRRRTREVAVGDVVVGGSQPIRVQSMTTTRTQDVDATLAQVLRLVDVGCEIVRITAPTLADAQAIGEIMTRLRARGVRVPIVADIHFNPAAALEAAKYADKVRINPGNFADQKNFRVREYTDPEYQAEIDRIDERFTPVVRACQARGISMRLGCNHGSLSDRIMNRFGDTPLGMVEAALEFLRIAEKLSYYDTILSMKSSNPKVMIEAYRLLVARMDQEGLQPYPLHLGVTEAGLGEDGRIKSAVGIGTLLDDGLGDTVRVSLTEEPEAEVPVAQRLVAPYNVGLPWTRDFSIDRESAQDGIDPYTYQRRPSERTPLTPTVAVGGSEVVAVVEPPEEALREDSFRTEGMAGPAEPVPWYDAIRWYRELVEEMQQRGDRRPIALRVSVPDGDEMEVLLRASTALGSLLCDGIGDAVGVWAPGLPEERERLAFGILQAAGTRITKTEYVSCPSCGRTLFDLQTTTHAIQRRTGHMKGVKIAVMGCVVNGPGEMADADFGYVGGAPGRVNLYVGREVREKGVPEGEAEDRLVALMQKEGKWTETEPIT